MHVYLQRLLLRITAAVAIAGGVLLLVLAGVTVWSIVGRALPDLPGLGWWRPVRGDFELVEIGTAIAIFAFLPYAQMTGAHVRVEALTTRASPRVKALLEVPAQLLLTVLTGLLTWKMAEATIDLASASLQQTTMLLRLPLWWGYLPATLCAGLFCVTSAFSLWKVIDGARGAARGGELEA